MLTRCFEFANTIEVAFDVFLEYQKDPTKDAYESNLMNYFKNNDLQKSINAIFKCVNDKPSMVKTLYDKTYGQLSALSTLRIQLSTLIFSGTAAETTACILVKVKNDQLSYDDAYEKCYEERKDFYTKKENLFHSQFDKYMDMAEKDYGDNIQNYIETTYTLNDVKNKEHSIIANDMYQKLKERYDWLDLMVIVYHPLKGFENHVYNTNGVAASKLRFHQEINWIVFADRKDNVVTGFDKKSLTSLIDYHYDIYKRREADGERKSFDRQAHNFKNWLLEPALEKSGILYSGIAVVYRLQSNTEERTDFSKSAIYENSNKFFRFDSHEFTIMLNIIGKFCIQICFPIRWNQCKIFAIIYHFL